MATRRKTILVVGNKTKTKTKTTKKKTKHVIKPGNEIVSAEMDKLAKYMSKGYPFAYKFVKPKELIEKIREYKPIIRTWGFTYLYANEVPEITDHRFREKYYSVDISLWDYNNLDIIVDYYTEKSRLKCTKPDMPTPFERLETKGGLLEFAIKYLIKKNQKLTYQAIRDAIYRYPKSYICSGESVLFYKGLIELLYGENGEFDYTKLNIMDGAIGYGQRLMTALVLKCNYIGIDPNTETIQGCRQMIKDLATTGKSYGAYPEYFPSSPHINNTPANSQDLIFFSPPAFDEEIYGTHEGQSILLFPTFDDWLENFLKHSLDILVSKLKSDGYLIIQSRKIKYIYAHLIHNIGLEFKGVIARRTYSDKYKPNHIFMKKN